MYDIRKATLNDYDAIESLHQELSNLHIHGAPWNFENIHPSYTEELYHERLQDKNTFVYVAEYDHTIVAYAIFQICHSDDDFPILRKRDWLFIKDIIVTQEQKWKWIGSLLLKKWEEIAKEMNLWSMELHVWSFNQEALEFYTRKWYEPYTIKMRKSLSCTPNS